MAEKKINPGLKAALEFGPILLFFVAYLLMRDREFVVGGETYQGFIFVTAGFVPLLAICTLLLWRLTGHLSVMQVLTLVLVTVFGGLTVWLNDDRFFKMKPTIIYLLFGGALGVGLLRGKSYLRAVAEGLMPLDDAGWMKLTKRFSLFFLGLAIANEVIWRSMSTDAWVTFKTFGLPIAMIAFIFSQNGLMQAHALPSEDTPKKP